MIDYGQERLFKFPPSEWIRQLNRIKGDLPAGAFCICYQYNVDEAGNGPYGFMTSKAVELLSVLFSNIKYYDISDSKLKSGFNLNNKGVYLYGDKLNEFEGEIQSYNSVLLKRRLRINKNLSVHAAPEKPDLLKLYGDQEIDAGIVNILLTKHLSLLFSCFLTPMAGTTFILFDIDKWELAKEFCKSNNINILEVGSVDDLRAW